MSRLLLKPITFLLALLSFNVAALQVFTSSDYDVAAGDSVTLTFYDWSPSFYWPPVFTLYVTKPGGSRVIAQSGITSHTTTVTLDTPGTNLYEVKVCKAAEPSVCSGLDSLQITVSSLPKPAITISYPTAFHAGDRFNLEVTTSHAASCTFKYSATGSSQSFGTYLKVDNLTYSTPGSYVQSATCTGPGGSTTVNHAITVLSALPQPGPIITSFLNGDVIVGQTKLYWNSNNTDRCTLSSGSTTANVGTSALGYGASVPVGGRTFTLACFQNSLSVSKELFVPRPIFNNSPCTNYCESVVKPTTAITKLDNDRSDLLAANNAQNQFVAEHNSALKSLGINLSEAELTFTIPDLNDDGYGDLVIYQPKQQRVQVLLNSKGSFDSVAATAEWVNDRRSINAIRIDADGQVTVEIMPSVVIAK
ncbi:MAG: hypothetical protein ACI8WB_000789 [Phenylobacterium sp.]|jgi:hypothetical protein